MIKKSEKGGFLKFGLKASSALVAVELIVFAAAYYQYRRINTDQTYRFKLYKKSSKMLDWYYSVGERLGGLDTRQQDLKYFKSMVLESEK